MAVRSLYPSVVISKRDNEYVVYYRPSVMPDARKRDASAYYTTDIDDAHGTAKRMHDWAMANLPSVHY